MIGPAELILAIGRAVLPRTARRLTLRKLHQFNRIAAQNPPVSEVTVYLQSDELKSQFERFGRVEIAGIRQDVEQRAIGQGAGGQGAAVGSSRTYSERLTVVPLRRRVSLISTCRNEAATIESWLNSILSQDVYPDEIVICDAGSTDGTRQKIVQWYEQIRSRPFILKVIDAPGANIARGRNLAVQMSHGELLLFTDAGCVLDSGWVRMMLEPYSIDKNIDLVMGWYRQVDGPRFARDFGAGAESTDGSGITSITGKLRQFRASILKDLAHFTVPRLERIDPSTFLPSARSMAVTRSSFNRSGGFPEYLTFAGEDSLFDYYLKSNARKAAFVPQAEVKWFMPQTIPSFFRMLFRYSRGDAEGGKLFWNHYRSLLIAAGRISLDGTALLLLLILAAWLPGESALRSAALFLAAFCAVSIAVRTVQLARPFQPLEGTSTFPARLSRCAALGLMLTAQTAGFLRGLAERGRTETRRLWSASAGYMFVFGPGWCVRGGEDPAQQFAERNLALRHFVIYVSTDKTPANQPILHPRLEQHSADGFDLRIWLRKHRGHLRTSPTIVLAAPVKGVDSSKLLNSLRSRFPDSPLIELG